MEQVKYKIIDDRIDNKFILHAIEDKKNIGYIEYSVEDNVLSILHTVVFDDYKGMGFAKILMEYIIKFSEENKYAISPVCSYAKYYMQDMK